jgi:hypothetical protein
MIVVTAYKVLHLVTETSAHCLSGPSKVVCKLESDCATPYSGPASGLTLGSIQAVSHVRIRNSHDWSTGYDQLQLRRSIIGLSEGLMSRKEAICTFDQVCSDLNDWSGSQYSLPYQRRPVLENRKCDQKIEESIQIIEESMLLGQNGRKQC